MADPAPGPKERSQDNHAQSHPRAARGDLIKKLREWPRQGPVHPGVRLQGGRRDQTDKETEDRPSSSQGGKKKLSGLVVHGRVAEALVFQLLGETYRKRCD